MSFQLLLENWQGSSIPDGGGKIIPPARNGERECSGEWFWASLWWYHEASLTSRSQTSGGDVLVDYLAAWKLLPNMSWWVMHTVEQGYRSALPPPFNGVIPTLVGPEQALVMEQEVSTPVEGGHRGGPSSRQRVWVLQPYSIVPGKDVGLRPFLDLS